MNSEKKEGEVPDNFGKVVEELHNKQKLSALRTYQGDMAQFIREKDESVISVKLKEKEMSRAVKELDFETAAILRDEIVMLKEQLTQ